MIPRGCMIFCVEARRDIRAGREQERGEKRGRVCLLPGASSNSASPCSDHTSFNTWQAYSKLLKMGECGLCENILSTLM